MDEITGCNFWGGCCDDPEACQHQLTQWEDAAHRITWRSPKSHSPALNVVSMAAKPLGPRQQVLARALGTQIRAKPVGFMFALWLAASVQAIGECTEC